MPGKRYYEPKRRGPIKRFLTTRGQKAGRAVSHLVFDADGAPRAWLRALLFDRYRRPRPVLDAFACKRPGQPRRAFANWMAGADEELPPLVADLPWPAPFATPPVLFTCARWSPGTERLAADLSIHRQLLVLLLDGAAPDDLPFPVIAPRLSQSAIPREVLLRALARRAATFSPRYAVVLGLDTAEVADQLEQANIPVVAVPDAPATPATRPDPLILLLERASAVLFPSEPARQLALSLAPGIVERGQARVSEIDAAPIDAAGTALATAMEREVALILAADPMRLELHNEAALRELVAQWRLDRLLGEPLGRRPLRRPFAGFHPLIYAELHAPACLAGRRYPLSHWIENGRPRGPWTQPLIFPPASPLPASPLKSALHSHLFYPELLGELLAALTTNATRPDLFLTTSDDAKAALLRAAVRDYPARVDIRVVPNRGRDIGPFLTGLREELLDGGYDVFFHLHGKKTKGRRREIGDPWRAFLTENLVGGAHPMLDAILARFAAEPDLGLAYPEDPHLVDWGRNGRIVDELRRDMGITEPMTAFVEFPVGTMFAARPATLRPLLDLDLGWDDYPEEPLPDDGTLLHGIERLLPMITRRAGFRVAGARVPGTGWD